MKVQSDYKLELKQQIENLLKKHNLEWEKLNIWETSEGFLIEVETPKVSSYLEAINLSDKLENELKHIGVSIAVIPSKVKED